MSSLGGGGSGLAGLSRVAFEATGVGETTRDIERVESVYRSSTSDMSDQAIKHTLAVDRQQRALRKGPSAFREQANSELALRRAERELRGETDLTTRSLDRQQRELGQASRGALLGTGAFRSLGRSVAFASAGFLGGAGLVYGMRQAISVASNLEEQTSRVGVTFGDSANEVLAWARTTSTSMGIAQDQALAYAGTLGSILKASGQTRAESANLSRELVGLAADMASFNNASPEETLAAIRSGLTGEIEPLRRYGVLLSEAASRQEALRMTGKKSAEDLTQGEKVLARYSLILKQTTDQQGDYARTADSLANSQRTLSALWRDAQGLVGQALAPAYTDAVQGLRDWLAVQENQEQLQRTVNALVGDAEKIVRGFAGGLRVVKDAASPVVEAMGGIENAVRGATLLWVAFKVKAILGFGATALASRTTATRMVADAAVAGRAWDVATRPRHMVVTGGGIPGGRGGGALSLLGVNPVTAIVAGAAAAAYFGLKSNQAPAVDDSEFGKLKQAARQGKFTGVHLEDGRQYLTDDQYRALRQIILNRSRRQSDQQAPPRGEGRPTQPFTGPKPGGLNGANVGRTLADIELDIARPGNEMGDLREKRSFIQRQIDAMEKRGVRTKEQKDKLAGLYGDLASAESAIQSIISEGEQKIEDQRADAKEKHEAAREAAAAKLRERIAGREETLSNQQAAAELTKRLSDDRAALRRRIAFYREMSRNGDLEASERRAFVGKRIAVQKELQDLNQKAAKDRQDAEDKAFDEFEKKTRERDLRSTKKFDALSGFGGGLGAAGAYKRGVKRDAATEKGITAEQVRSMQFEFLTSLQGTMNQFGGNLFEQGSLKVGGDGAPNPELWTMSSELVRQTEILSGLASGMRQPGSRYARYQITESFQGPTF